MGSNRISHLNDLEVGKEYDIVTDTGDIITGIFNGMDTNSNRYVDFLQITAIDSSLKGIMDSSFFAAFPADLADKEERNLCRELAVLLGHAQAASEINAERRMSAFASGYSSYEGPLESYDAGRHQEIMERLNEIAGIQKITRAETALVSTNDDDLPF